MSETNNPRKPVISFTKEKPYLVTGLGKMTDADGNDYKTTRAILLCRCGLSKKKPYCDGSHTQTGIDGEKKPDRKKDKIHNFVGKEVTIHDNRGVCSKDGSCVKFLPEVFKPGRRPWIDPNAASAEDIIRVIEMCPSGALSYTIGGVTHTTLDREPQIIVAKNGPFEIRGGIEIKDDMNSKPQSEEHYTLCRCGASKNKPFCDGAHYDVKFLDDVEECQIFLPEKDG